MTAEPPGSGPSSPSGPARSALGAVLGSGKGPIVVLGFALLAARLLLMIDANAVNVLYWDQWDFFEALFDDVGPWETFRWQHGPHRQGIGLLLTRVVASLSHWNTRADAFATGLLVVAAAAAFLWLRRRLLGPLRIADLAIPVLVLTPAQYGIFIHTVNASHGAAPLLLLAAYGLALTIERPAVRVACLLLLNFLLLHTGFGVFAGLLTPCLFAACALRAPAGRRALPLLALAGALLSGVVFLVGYEFDALSTAPASRSPHALDCARFVALMLANLCGVKGRGPLATGFGIALLAAGLLVVGPRALQIARGRSDATDRVVVFLMGFSLLFCLGAAVGRVGMGFGMAQSTRYVPLTLPFGLGIVLHLAALPAGRARTLLQAGALVGLIAATFPMRAPEARFMEYLRSGKRRWVEVYRETHDIAAADAAAHLKIYPWEPERTRLQQKLDWLEKRKLNLFAP